MNRTHAAGRSRRPGWQRALRAAVAAALLLALAYATMPWWLPTQWVARRLEAQLAAQWGIPVRIGNLRLSWSRGVEVASVRADGPPGFGDRPLLEVDAVRCEFSPVGLLRGRIGWMVVERPRVHLCLDENGRINVAQLDPLRGGASQSRASAPQLRLDRLSVRQGLVTLSWPRDEDRFRLQISDAQVVAGRIESIGRVTLAARLEQPEHDSPIGLQVLTGADAQPSRARLQFGFRDVDLEALRLVPLLALPLDHLCGRADGRVSFGVDEAGRVQDFACTLGVRGLDVQPLAGPELPAIERAGVEVEGGFDFYSQIVTLRRLAIDLPGADLDGQAEFHLASVLEGQWLGWRSAWLEGRIDPAAAMALLRGHDAPLAGGLKVDGGVGVRLAYRRDEGMLVGDLTLDASAARLSLPHGEAKPAGEPLIATITATCRPRTWEIAFDRTELRLGGNVFVGRQGSLDNVRDLLQAWSQARSPWSAGDLQRAASGLNWAGGWEVRDLRALRRLSPALDRALADVRLDGALTGEWALRPGSPAALHADVVCPREALLAVGERFVKPVGRSATVELRAELAGEFAGLGEVDLELTCGGGVIDVHLDHFVAERLVRAGPPTTRPAATAAPADRVAALAGAPARRLGALLDSMPGGAGTLDAVGTFRVDRMEELLASLPGTTAWRDQVSGACSGSFALQTAPDAVRVHLSLDAAQARLSLPGRIDKPLGQPATVMGNWLGQPQHGSAVDFQAGLAGATVQGRLSVRGESDWTARGHVAVYEVAWLAEQVPAVRDALRQVRCSGSGQADVRVRMEGDELHTQVEVVADGLDLATLAGDRQKARGVPLRLEADGTLHLADSPPRRAIELRTLHAALGGSAIDLRGRAALEGEQLVDLDLGVDWIAVVGRDLLAAVPELVPAVQQAALAGTVRGGGRVYLPPGQGADAAAAGTFRADGRLDLADLSFATPSLRKPAAVAGALTFESTWPGNRAGVQVNHWSARLGPLEAMGGADVRWQTPEGARLPVPTSVSSHFRAWVARAEDASVLAPALADLHAAGDVEISGELAATPESLRLKYATVRFREFSVLRQGRRPSLDGSLHLAELVVPRSGGGALVPDALTLGRVHSDGLTVRLAPSAATLLLDVRGWPDALRGPSAAEAFGRPAVLALADEIDLRDVQAYLDGLSAPAPTAPPATAGAPPVEPLLEAMRRYLAPADLAAEVRIGRLRNYRDPKSGQVYDVGGLALRFGARAGVVDLAYDVGVSGGTLSERMVTDLAAAEPVVAYTTAVREMLASPSLQPQIDAFFPGNELKGRMSQDRRVEAPLPEVLANLLDPAVPVRWDGEGTTVFVDGITRGKAAPAFVTRLLPGLDLVEYAYDRMVSFSDYRRDGTVHNDMVFSGKTYDMYIEGRTDAEGFGNYEIGVILLGSRQAPEWNHRYRQGRFPVLKWRARIVDGQRVDEEISYPWPNETVGTILLKNNIFYRLWLEAGK